MAQEWSCPLWTQKDKFPLTPLEAFHWPYSKYAPWNNSVNHPDSVMVRRQSCPLKNPAEDMPIHASMGRNADLNHSYRTWSSFLGYFQPLSAVFQCWFLIPGHLSMDLLKALQGYKGYHTHLSIVNNLPHVDLKVNSCPSTNPTDADARGRPVYTGSRQDSPHLSNRPTDCELHCRPSTVTWPSSNRAQLWSLR